MSVKEEYKDIAPYDDNEFHHQMELLVAEPGFKHAVTYAMPGVDYDEFVKKLLTYESRDAFQIQVMAQFLELLASTTTKGITINGLENLEPDASYTYISNHRNIVLDASFLNLCIIRMGYMPGEIAIGDNLMIYDWIERLVKINKGFLVKRNLRLTKALEAAKQLSGYIHYCLNVKDESIWIAQREGRAKDSNDRTQESVIKMLALGGKEGSSVIDSLREINIAPVTVSYEYDPTDYLKATEFLLKHKDPNYAKSDHDDLLGMEIGLLGQKGRVHYEVSPCLNDTLESMRHITDRNELFAEICSAMDRRIHLGYRFFPVNYISYDRLHDTDRFADKYTAEEIVEFDNYISGQLDKVRLEDVTAEDREFMLNIILKIYANPVVNYLSAKADS